MRKTVSIKFNHDSTITVKVGRAVEHASIEAKTKSEIFDFVKYAIISKDLRLSDIEIAEILWRQQ